MSKHNGAHNLTLYSGYWLAVCQHCGERGRIELHGCHIGKREAAKTLRAWGWRFGDHATCPSCAKGGSA